MMKTNLVCPCGARLAVSVQKRGWLLSVIAIALASHWVVNPARIVSGEWSNEMPATCPKCWHKPKCQCRDC
jgi:hypothetical protein